MSALQDNVFSTENIAQCRHFGVYVIVIRLFKQILRNFENLNFLQKNALFEGLHCGPRARKNRDFEAS